jgi:hypothetical protein
MARGRNLGAAFVRDGIASGKSKSGKNSETSKFVHH